MIWSRTSSGRWMLVDAEPDPKGNLRLEAVPNEEHPKCSVAGVDPASTRYMTHFKTCPDAEAWRHRTASVEQQRA